MSNLTKPNLLRQTEPSINSFSDLKLLDLWFFNFGCIQFAGAVFLLLPGSLPGIPILGIDQSLNGSG